MREELEKLIAEATPGPWFTLGPPWLPSGTETSILAGSDDPHVATFIADMDMWALDDDDSRKSKNPDADARLIVALRNNAPAILKALTERASMAAEIERLREANGILEDGLQEVGDDYPGSSCQEWCQHQIKMARAALEIKP